MPQSEPPAQTSRFQTGTDTFSASIAKRAAANASGRCGADTAATTELSPRLEPADAVHEGDPARPRASGHGSRRRSRRASGRPSRRTPRTRGDSHVGPAVGVVAHGAAEQHDRAAIGPNAPVVHRADREFGVGQAEPVVAIGRWLHSGIVAVRPRRATSAGVAPSLRSPSLWSEDRFPRTSEHGVIRPSSQPKNVRCCAPSAAAPSTRVFALTTGTLGPARRRRADPDGHAAPAGITDRDQRDDEPDRSCRRRLVGGRRHRSRADGRAARVRRPRLERRPGAAESPHHRSGELATPIGDGRLAHRHPGRDRCADVGSLGDSTCGSPPARRPSGGSIVTHPTTTRSSSRRRPTVEPGHEIARDRPDDREIVTVMASPPITVAYGDVDALDGRRRHRGARRRRRHSSASAAGRDAEPGRPTDRGQRRGSTDATSVGP